jgi:hypothetical protein
MNALRTLQIQAGFIILLVGLVRVIARISNSVHASVLVNRGLRHECSYKGCRGTAVSVTWNKQFLKPQLADEGWNNYRRERRDADNLLEDNIYYILR